MNFQIGLRSKLNLILFILIFSLTTLVSFLIYKEMRPQFLEAVEYTLKDISRVLSAEMAELAEQNQGKINTELLTKSYQRYLNTRFPERNEFDRDSNNHLLISITDANGKLIFHSQDPNKVGSDYSQWRDVFLSLKNQYGARATRTDLNKAESSTHFISAPVKLGDQIIGVLTLGKSVQSFNGFLSASKIKVLLIFFISLVLAALVSIFTSHWVVKPIIGLDEYVKSLKSNKETPFPKLPEDEIGHLGTSFRNLQLELEGKKYIENYVHSLTHEIKAPLTGILGASELLQQSDSITPENQKQLLNNIRIETKRTLSLVEQLLELASLEARNRPLNYEHFDLGLLVDEVVESLNLQAKARQIHIIATDFSITLNAERFLVWRALANVVQNAIDFSTNNSKVEIHGESNKQNIIIRIKDYGTGIPDFALEKVKEKFFSLERPHTGKKSSGLGLNFVQEVMTWHQGSLQIQSQFGHGTEVLLMFPYSQSG